MLGYLKYLLGSIILTAALAGLVWLAVWRVYDVHLYSVQSGSMAPAFVKGDLLADVPAFQPKTGDIITYASPTHPGQLVSHRVINISGGTIITKGDNLPTADPPVTRSAVLGRAVTVIPKAGYVFDSLRKPAGLIAFVYLPALIITTTELWLLSGRYKYQAYRFTQTA